jgi:2-deoxy-D-gluconate 3-dehydrogenase
MLKMFDLTGKKAIVTGGGGGIGKGMALGLYKAGAELVLIGSSNKVENAAAEFNAIGTGPKVQWLRADLSDESQIEPAFNKAVEMLGGTIDILVNNAGMNYRAPAEDYPKDKWDKIIQLNLTTPFLLCQLAGRIMLKKGKGKIINVCSLTSLMGGYTIPAYTASKGGIAQLTKDLANEWSGRGVNVNGVAPGYTDTELNTGLLNDPVRYRQITERIPAGRWGVPADFEGIAVYMASDASDYMCGAIVPICGAYLTR